MLNLLFVYGTLRRGHDNRFAAMLAEAGEFVGEGSVNGELHPAGPYQGLNLGGKCIVRGEVFRLPDAHPLYCELDQYEGPEFPRTSAIITMDSGHEFKAWVYVFKPGNFPDESVV